MNSIRLSLLAGAGLMLAACSPAAEDPSATTPATDSQTAGSGAETAQIAEADVFTIMVGGTVIPQ